MIDLETTPLPELLSELRASDEALFGYLDLLAQRFAAVEGQVQAFIPESQRFARLRREAGDLLARYPTPDERPPLFGLPVGVKDIFHVEGFATQAGSRLDSELLQGSEATAVQQVRRAGALILGKTVTTEFAYFAPGPTRNPHNLAHTPGGSSSGSAAAVAAGLCALTFGTQTIGSVNRPASFCGVVGYKPSYDRISKEGVIPVASSVDHVGLFSRRAADLPPAVALLVEGWREVDVSGRPVLGVPEGPYLSHASEEGLAHFNETCLRLQEAGFTLKRTPLLADFDEIRARHELIVAAEAAQTHEAWYAGNSILYHPKTAELIDRGQAVAPDALKQARQGRTALREAISAVMETQGVDLWLSPSAVGAAPVGLESTGDPVMNLPWTHAGLPTITLPSGRNHEDLPLGLQLTAGWYRDEALLHWARALEATLRM